MAKVVKFVFSHSKLRKQPFLLRSSKSRGASPPCPHLTTPMDILLLFQIDCHCGQHKCTLLC